MRASRVNSGFLLIVSFAIGFAPQKSLAPDLNAITNPASWTMHHASPAIVQDSGKKVARLKAEMDSANGFCGLAIANNFTFDIGTIDIDLKGMGGEKRCFLGVAFNVADETTFEAIYFRPFNFRADDEHKIHAVQYLALPEHTWEELRKNRPGQFEKPITSPPDPDQWFHARVEVGEKQVKVFVNDAKEPALTVDRLEKSDKPRPVGLFVDSHEGMYDKLKITAEETMKSER